MADFISDFDVGHIPHVADTEGSIWLGFEVISQPAWAFVNDNGDIDVVIGSLGHDALRERIEALAAA